MVENNKHTPKRTPFTRKIKRLLLPEKGRYMHKLSPESYFCAYWFNEPDSNGIKVIARIKEVSQKEAAHIIFVEGFKKIMGQLAKEELDQMDKPEEQTEIAKHTRFYLELSRICREQGWDIKKLF